VWKDFSVPLPPTSGLLQFHCDYLYTYTVNGINSVTALNERNTFNFVTDGYKNIISSNQYYLALYMIYVLMPHLYITSIS
jgi:hypothetical protein